MNKPVILCDVDEVLAGLLDEWVYRYNLAYGDDLEVENISSWDLCQHVKPECGKRIYEFLADKDIYRTVAPVKGSIQGISELRKLGRVVFVTSANTATMRGKTRWLEQWGFLDDSPRHSDLILAHDKSLIRGDILIDDGPHNIEAFPGDTILFDQPYNREVDHPYRARTWPEVVEIAKEILG